MLGRLHAEKDNGLLQRFRYIWTRYKIMLLRVVLFLLLAVSIAAAIVPGFGQFLANNQYWGFAIIVMVVLLLFDAIVSASRPPEDMAHTGPVLTHFSELRKYVSQAFDSDVVELDIACYSGETFYNVLSEFLNDVAEGKIRLRRLHIRLMVPDLSKPLAVPCLVDSLEENDVYKTSIQERNRRFAGEFSNYFARIRQSGFVQDAHMEIRLHHLAPLFKMIIINHQLAFLGFYAIAETPVTLGDHTVCLWDYRGERTRFVGLRTDGSMLQRELFTGLNDWYHVVWDNLTQTITFSGAKE